MRRAAAPAWLIGVAALALGGCGTAPPPPASWIGPGPSPSAALEKLHARAQAFRTVRAALELTWHGDGDEDATSCRGSLSWVPPDSLRLRGTTAAFFTVFDLVADERRVMLDIPREGVAIFGSREDPAWDSLPLSARELRVALLADPCESAACRDSARWESEDPPVLASADWRLRLDPGTGLPLEWSRADGHGRRIRWSEWSVRDGVAWPSRVELEDPVLGEFFEVAMGRVDLDRPIPPGRFRLEVEEGREILTPEEAKVRLERRGARVLAPDAEPK